MNDTFAIEDFTNLVEHCMNESSHVLDTPTIIGVPHDIAIIEKFINGGAVVKSLKINVSELNDQFNGDMDFIYGEGEDIYEKDLKGKVNFDLENITYESCDVNTIEDEAHTGEFILEGIPLFGCHAGGDWEHPVYFILFNDVNGDLRGYVPIEGNTFNKKTMTAYGSEGDYEGDEYTEEEIEDMENSCPSDLDLDYEAIEKDIIAYLKSMGVLK